MKMLLNGKFSGALFALFLATSIIGCGGGGAAGGDDDGGGGGSTSTAQSVALASSDTSVNSDNSDSVTITATVLDTNNLVLPNQAVQFQASSGVVIASSSTTDSNGQVTATFSSGTLDKTNRTATITVTATGSTASGAIPIQITGSTLTVTAPSTSPTAGTAVPVTATAKAVAANVANQPLRFSIAASSTGSGTLSATSATTNASGVASVNFTGTAAGTVNVLVEWLDGTGVATASATQSFNVQASGSAFEVTTPLTAPNSLCTESPCAVTLGTTQSLAVTVPATINGTAVGSLRYATTLGTWQASAAKTRIVNSPGASDAQTFLAGNFAGNANIQIDAMSGANGTGTILATAKLVFALSASAASANSITLQSNVSSLAPSSGGTSSTATLTARVRDAALNAVGGASVLFELVNPTGSGEQVDPVVVSTNSSGFATSTFTAGTATVQTSQIRASVVGNGAVPPSTINITVGGTAGSIAIGTSTTITSVNSDTSYKLPVTVMVTDSNGNAVSGATVSLSLWGQGYFKGSRAPLAPCTASVGVTGPFPNEDTNENLIRDLLPTDEDVDGPGGTPDDALWPSSSAVGSVPATVITGTDGTATFDWVYLKQYADWIIARLRAKALVQGSEATTTTLIRLAPSKPDVEACVLPASPFN